MCGPEVTEIIEAACVSPTTATLMLEFERVSAGSLLKVRAIDANFTQLLACRDEKGVELSAAIGSLILQSP